MGKTLKKEKKNKTIKERLDSLELYMAESAGVLQLHHQFIQMLLQQDEARLRALGVIPPAEKKGEEKKAD